MLDDDFPTVSCYLAVGCAETFSRFWDDRLRAWVYVHGDDLYIPSMSVHPDRIDDMVADWMNSLHRDELGAWA